jgi:hypothetical protein
MAWVHPAKSRFLRDKLGHVVSLAATLSLLHPFLFH